MIASLGHRSIAGLAAAQGAGRHRIVVMASRGMAMSPEERARLLAKSWTAVASNYERWGYERIYQMDSGMANTRKRPRSRVESLITDASD